GRRPPCATRAKARREVISAPPVARAPTLRNSRRFMAGMMFLRGLALAAQELRRREQQGHRLLGARRVRDRAAGRLREVGAEQLRGELDSVAPPAEPSA